MKNRILAILLVLVMMVGVVIYINPISMVMEIFKDGDSSEIVDSTEVNLEEEGLRNTVLYYKDDKGFLVPVMRKIPWEEGIGKATLKKLINTEENKIEMEGMGLMPVIPSSTQIKGMNIKDGLCTVNFSKEFLNLASKSEEEMVLRSIVYTLTEFNTIDKVDFMIEGKEVNKFQFGTDMGLDGMTRKDINYVGNNENEHKAVVYYESTTNGIESYFVPVTKELKKTAQTGVTLLNALDALVEGPPEGSGLYSDIPAGTRVIGVEINDSVACINLSEEIGEIEEDKELAQKVSKYFALTVKEIYGDVVGVKLFKDGKKLEVKENKEPVAVPTFANEY
ncbi:MAG: GerMN domain-containing protein [Anaeromicrobium sp.]|jgi:germination protein M|uniref:GerMN domain-containing protein n=1 Tax=Anaeromicrobium sp. TaxID=1929132 RepID=UPI0026012B21|nr:GerMN domain-containing protein [Anaeromicrobium sp.]MCT4593225.1 GerMN domain-containing protein [Anaeromicrobium sp.]